MSILSRAPNRCVFINVVVVVVDVAVGVGVVLVIVIVVVVDLVVVDVVVVVLIGLAIQSRLRVTFLRSFFSQFQSGRRSAMDSVCMIVND